MSILVLLAAAAATMLEQQPAAPALRGPEPTNAATVVRVEDYPAEAQRSRQQGRTRLAITVDPTGRPTACAVTQSSGSTLLDQTGCRLMQRRARFRPATLNGERVHGVLLTYTAFLLPDAGTVPSPPVMFDVAVGVSRLPDNRRWLAVDINRRLAADGSIVACEIKSSSGFALYDGLACRNAGTAPIPVIRDGSGAAVEGVLTERILFVLTPVPISSPRP